MRLSSMSLIRMPLTINYQYKSWSELCSTEWHLAEWQLDEKSKCFILLNANLLSVIILIGFLLHFAHCTVIQLTVILLRIILLSVILTRPYQWPVLLNFNAIVIYASVCSIPYNRKLWSHDRNLRYQLRLS